MRLGIRRRDVEVIPEGARKCAGCGAVKRLDAFRQIKCARHAKSYPRGVCLACERMQRREAWRRWYYEGGGREAERNRVRDRGQPKDTPVRKLQKAKADCRYRIAQLRVQIKQIDRELSRMRGDDVE